MRHPAAIASGVAFVVLIVLAGRFSIAKDEEKKEAAQESPKPGPEHEALEYFAGKWEGKTGWRMNAGDAFLEGTMSEETRKALSGLWFISDMKGKNEMGEYEGHGVLGYDTQKKKYVGFWVDSMATYAFPYEGMHDKASKTWTYTGTMKDMEGKDLKVTLKSVIKDKDHYNFSIHHADPSGKDMEAFRIDYTRKK